jgi:hypothetical protein
MADGSQPANYCSASSLSPSITLGRSSELLVLTGGLLVRVQPEEPISLANLSTRPRRPAFCDVACDITFFAREAGFATAAVVGSGSDVSRSGGFERIRGLIQRLAANVAVGLHHLGRDVPDLRLDHPVWQSLFRERRNRRVSAIVEAHMRSSCAKTRPRGLRGLAVVEPEQAAEPRPAGDRACADRRCLGRDELVAQTLVRPLLMIMLDKRSYGSPKVRFAEWHDPLQALGLGGPHKPLGKRVQIGTPGRQDQWLYATVPRRRKAAV